MKIFYMTRIAKLCNKAVDGDGIGSGAGGGNWEMGPLAFIDDPEQDGLGIKDPLNRKPTTLEDQLSELDGDGKKGDDEEEDDAEEDDGKKEDTDDEEEVEDADAEEDDEDDEDDEEEEDDDDDEEEEAPKAAKGSAVAGLKAEISRLRTRAQAAEGVKLSAERRVAVLEKQVNEEIPALKAELKALIKQRNTATVDEDTDAMTEADMALEEVRAKISKIEAQADAAKERASDAQAEIDAVIQEAAIKACATYPVLDPQNTKFDSRLVDMINAVYSSNLSKKMSVVDAFEQALEGVMEMTGHAPKVSAKADKAKAAQKEDAQARRKQAARDTTKTTTGKQRGADTKGDSFRFNQKDFSTRQGLKKLQSELGIIIPK